MIYDKCKIIYDAGFTIDDLIFSVVIWGLTTYVIFCCWYQAKKHKYIFGEYFLQQKTIKKRHIRCI